MSLDALINWQVGEPRQQFNDRLGVGEWVLVYVIPNNEMAGAKEHFKAALTNRLPGHNTADVYAPCVHQANPVPSTPTPENHEVTVILRRPTRSMILQPGRGLLSFTSYANLRIEEVGVLKHSEVVWEQDGSDVSVSTARLAGASERSLFTPGETIQERWTLKRERQQIIDVRSVIVATVVDWGTAEAAIFARADGWLGKGGSFGAYANLKCMKVEIERRPENVRWLESKWFFAKRDEKWPEAGIVEVKWYAVSMPSGTEIEDFKPPEHASDTGPLWGFGQPTSGVLAEGDTGWMAITLRNEDNDVISGQADFSPIETYLTWLGGS